MKKGYLYFKTNNFKPEEEFELTEIKGLRVNYVFPDKTVKGFKFKDDLTDNAYSIKYLDKDEIKDISDEELQIMRNYPYALAGYDFSDKKLKDYFSKFLWYVPTGKDVKLGEYDYDYIKDVDKVINDRKNGK